MGMRAPVLLIGTEVVVTLADGWTLRSGTYDPATADFISGEYVRLCNPNGAEYLYWDQEEWQTDPVLVMGAILNAAAGLRDIVSRRLQITNVYEEWDEVTTIVWADLPQRELTVDEMYEWVFPLTGTGHETGNSAYFVRSVDGLEPVIECDFGLWSTMTHAIEALRIAAHEEERQAADRQAESDQRRLDEFYAAADTIDKRVHEHLWQRFGLPPTTWAIDWNDIELSLRMVGVTVDVDAAEPLRLLVAFGIDLTLMNVTSGGSRISSATDLLRVAESWLAAHPKPMGPGIYHFLGEPDPGDEIPLATDWFWQQGTRWVAVYAPWHEDDWWDYGVAPETVGAGEVVPVPWRRPITDVPTTGTLAWRDPAGFEIEVSAELALIRGGYQADVSLDQITPTQWRIYIGPRGLQDYEGGDNDGAILGPYGETYFDDIHGGRTAALAHLERVRLAEQSDTTQS